MTKAGKRVAQITALAAGAVTAVILVASLRASSHHPHPHRSLQDRKITWEWLDAEHGSDLNRLETPHGWVVENQDGYLTFVPDHDKEWLQDTQ